MELVALGVMAALVGLALGLDELCHRLWEAAMTFIHVIGLVVAVLLLIYLVAALLKPEAF